VKTSGQSLVFIAGQVALDAQGQVVGEGDLRAQAHQVFQNLRTALEAAGASFEDVVKLVTYVVNYQPEHRALLAEVRPDYLPANNPPASTLLGVQALALPQLLIEIDAVAVLD
jgi:enamine deaminase RidA (YjgF/YER057c/UK114 family)